MERLTGIVQNYAWGSHTLLSTLRGEDVSALPEAEIWYGAHPVAPSVFDDGSTLLAAIEADPDAMVGADNLTRFGPRLPFLLKLLAAGQPLSIQAHPNTEQARIGFALENDAGIPSDAPERSFRDDNHKPELIAATTPFEALVGFREPARTVELLRGLDAPTEFTRRVADEGPKAAMHWLLDPQTTADRDAVASCIAEIVAGAERYADDQWQPEAELICRLAPIHPGDPGIGVAALLNYIVLDPDQALYLDAGVLHSYISGLGVEIMANCDNVVRGGLTTKHVDVATLLDIVSTESLDVSPVGEHNNRYASPAPEFSLTRVDATHTLDVSGPAIVIAVQGTTVAAGSTTETLAPTEAVWVPVGESISVRSTALAFIAEVPGAIA